MIKAALLRNLPFPDWLLNGSCFGERGLELEYDRILVRTINLHHTIKNLQPKAGLHVGEADELNNEARELDETLQDWAAHLPGASTYQRHILTEPGPWPRQDFYSSTVYSYSSIGYAAVWNQYFAARMLINNTRLRLLDSSCLNAMLDSTHAQQRQECNTQLNTMGNALASTIPFSLSKFKVYNSNSPTRQTSITVCRNEETKPYLANWVVSPLTIASSLEGTDVRLKQWFRSELARLGRSIGEGVLEYAETDQWVTL